MEGNGRDRITHLSLGHESSFAPVRELGRGRRSVSRRHFDVGAVGLVELFCRKGRYARQSGGECMRSDGRRIYQ